MASLYAVRCWFLWWERHQHVNGEESQTVERSASAIQALALNYTRAGSTVAHPTKQLRWIKPPQGMQKLNVDASYSYEDGTGACRAANSYA